MAVVSLKTKPNKQNAKVTHAKIPNVLKRENQNTDAYTVKCPSPLARALCSVLCALKSSLSC